MEIDVTCIGASSWDFCFTLPHAPHMDEKIVAENFVACGGGPAANAAVAISRLGLRSAFSGYLGKDEFGDCHLHELQSAGVVTDFIARGAAPTPVSSALISPEGERLLVNYTPPRKKLQANDFDFSDLRTKIILCDGHEPELALALIQQSRNHGVRSVLDAGSLHRGTKLLMSKVDYLVCSEKFAREFSGETDMNQALAKLATCNKNVVLTLGGAGLIWHTAAGRGRLSACKIKAIDTTGAGDAFHAAFAAGLAAGFHWTELLEFSSAAAACCCTRIGARTGMPTREDVLRLVWKQSPPGNAA